MSDWGGKRKGAGRPSTGSGDTVVIRVDAELKSAVEAMKARYKETGKVDVVADTVVPVKPGTENTTDIDALLEEANIKLPKNASKSLKAYAEKVATAISLKLDGQLEEFKRKQIADWYEENKVRLQKLKDDQALVEKAQKRINFFMSKEEFKLIRSCLHADSKVSDDKRNKAFTVFKRLGDTVKATEKWGNIYD